jgi:hypothetical protein
MGCLVSRLVRAGLGLVTLACLLVACSEARNSTGMISQRIGEAARAPGAKTVDLAKLTTFGWDRVYAFKPGATREEICAFLGANRASCGRVIRVERTPEGHVCMVFDLRGQVTHVEFHALSNGRFDTDFGGGGLPRERAVFTVRHSTGTGEIWLEPQ